MLPKGGKHYSDGTSNRHRYRSSAYVGRFSEGGLTALVDQVAHDHGLQYVAHFPGYRFYPLQDS